MVKRAQISKKAAPRVAEQFGHRLLAWYSDHGRDLPWRHTRDPYHILVSEIMLQQTRAGRALRYLASFLEVFPDLRTLAEAPLDRVLKMWPGMGYHARAGHLHAAAQIILKNHQGQVPCGLEALRALPGVGYNAAASVASLACGEAWPVLDGNAIRVLCRVFQLQADPRSHAQHGRLLALAKTLLPAAQAGSFNQALMDLGALICRPSAPQCPRCPLSAICEGFASGDPASLPRLSPRQPRPHYDIAAGIIWRGERFLIAQRRPGGFLGGLWEFPGGKREQGESLEQCLRREIMEELGIRIRVDGPFMNLKHGYKHFRFTLHAFQCTYLRGRPRTIGCAAYRWIQIEELQNYALPWADQKLAAVLRTRVRG